MKAWVGRSILLLALVVLAFWGWRWLFPNPELVIRKQLVELARFASFQPNEGELARVDNAQRVTTYFSPELKVVLDIPGGTRHAFSNRDELFKAALAVRTGLRSFTIDFPDINVQLGLDRTSASVDLTARGRMGGGEEFVQELRFVMKKVGRKWLITRVESVKTLTWVGAYV